MNRTLAVLGLFLALVSCKQDKSAPTGTGKQETPAAGDAEKDKKGLLDKAKEAVGNFKENASAPLTDSSMKSLIAIANDLKGELGKAAEAPGMDMKTLMSKAKDLKGVSEKNGVKVSELGGLVTRVTAVMGAIKSGNVPENMKADVVVVDKFKVELQSLFGK